MTAGSVSLHWVRLVTWLRQCRWLYLHPAAHWLRFWHNIIIYIRLFQGEENPQA